MRCQLIGAILLVAIAVQASAAEEAPYIAYVTSDDVYVRSGPGRNYYPTDKLPKGERVEVYRHDPGGWLAIRPPRDSFAWVAKRHLDTEPDSLATVNSDRVVARVGSRFSDVRDVVQVRLERGEKVELVAPPRDDSPWCKIAPPAGEFRWIFAKYVDRSLPADVVASQRDAELADGYVGETDEDSGVRLASSQSESADDLSEAPLDQAAGTRAPPTVDPTSIVGRKLAQLEVDLTVMVAKDIADWSFEDLRQRTNDLLNEAETPVERGQARILLGKLDRFEDIRSRHVALRKPGALLPSQPTAPVAQGTRPDMSQFDGVGRLSPVISEKVGGPQYALVDDSNAVISFVTPAPGVNLRPYVDRYVGVSGQRGYMTDLRRQHISVQRVTVLDVSRR